MRNGLPFVLLALVLTGCGVHRSVSVTSNPPGALLYLNGLEVGRTPVTRDFKWYGVYDVELRKEGYETLKTTGQLHTPWWQYVPIDLFAELMPFHLHDRQKLDFAMKPVSPQAIDPDVLIQRAGELRDQLESSSRTRSPGPPPAATKPHKKSSTTRASTQATSAPTALP